MKKLLLVLIVFNISMCYVHSQKKTVQGRVITDQFDIALGVSIMINDTVKVGVTDMDGYFKLDIPKGNKKITFKDIGLYPTTIELEDRCNKLEVIVITSGARKSISLKRADRQLKRRFKKLPEIHRQAFKKKLFETKYACYEREFKTFYVNKD